MELIELIETASPATSVAGGGLRLAMRAASSALAVALAGCTALVPRESPLPREGATMSEVYRNHMSGDLGQSAAGADSAGTLMPRDRLPLRGVNEDALISQRRALSQPLNNRFERLPNPDLTMFVFPHLAPGRYPVPGYETVFPMFESVQYAMPGEVAPRFEAGGSFTSPSPVTGQMPSPTSDRGDAAAQIRSQQKTQRLADLALVAPSHARVLTEYDRLYSQTCKTHLSGEQLFAVPASGAPAYTQMLAYTQAGRDSEGAQVGAGLMRCDAPPVAAKPGTSTRRAAPSLGLSGPRMEPDAMNTSVKERS